MTTFPHQVQLMLTERCNLRCAHCAVPAEDSPADHELRTAEWCRFIAVLSDAGVADLVISGGEALLRRDAIELATYAHEVGIPRTTIITNGMRFNPKTNDAIIAAQAAHRGFGVHVSLDGASAATHDWMRGSGSFDAIMSGIAALTASGGRITGIHTVFHRGNIDEFDDVASYVHGLGAENWTLFPIASVGRGRGIQDHALSKTEWEQLFEQGRSAAARYGLDVAPMGPILVDEWPAEPGAPVPQGRNELSSRLCVGPDGAVFSCPPLRGAPVGNSTEIGEASDWASVAARGQSLVEEHCPTCRFKFLCVGSRLDADLISYPHETSPVDPSETVPALSPAGRRALPLVKIGSRDA